MGHKHLCLILVIPLFWWQPSQKTNFGDELSRVIVEKITNDKVTNKKSPRLLALGSILHFAKDGDIIWGTGRNGKVPPSHHTFKKLDVRAVRGPLTRSFLLSRNIPCPEIYGDPALLLPILFPHYKPNPTKEYIVIPNLNEIQAYRSFPNLVLPTAPWETVLQEILSAKLVISGSLHGLIVAEAFGIPAQLLRITNKEHIFKYQDYYLGTGRPTFTPATSLSQALDLAGEPPPTIDLNLLYESFPFDIINGP